MILYKVESDGKKGDENMERKRIILIGGFGFIGMNLINKLIKNYDLIVLDLKNGINDKKIQWIKGDFRDKELLRSVISQRDIIVHLACTTIPSSSEQDIKKDIIENVFGILDLLEVCVEKKVCRLIFFSSGGTVYGELKGGAFKEDDTVNPINAHGIMKLTNEKYIKLFSRRGLEYVIVRPSNPYGRMLNLDKPQGIIDVLLKKLVSGDSIEIWGDGEIIRDYIYIDDFIDLIVKIIESKVSNEIINAGTGIGYSINQLIEIMKKIINKDIKIQYLNRRNFDVSANILDIRKAKEIYNWEPRLSLTEGITEIYNKLIGC